MDGCAVNKLSTQIIQLNKTPYESQKDGCILSIHFYLHLYSERLNYPMLQKDAMLPTYTVQIFYIHVVCLNGKIISQSIYQINQNH